MAVDTGGIRGLFATDLDRDLAQRAGEAAARCGTPAYVYDLDILDANIRRLESALSGVDLQLRYFEFANRNPAILERVRLKGHGIATARPTGVDRAIWAGFEPAQIELSGFGLVDAELLEAAKARVTINLASISELRRAAAIIPNVPIGVRVDISTGILDKRGIPAEELPAILRELPISVAGIHTYIGTNVGSTDTHLETIRRLLAMIDAMPPRARRELRYINAGGGFGYDYDDRKHFGWDAYGAVAKEMLDAAARRVGRSLQLKLEVGRSLVVDCGFLVVTINHAFQKQGQLFVAVDSNLSHCGRAARYGFDRNRPPFSDEGRHKLVHIGEVPDDDSSPPMVAAIVGNSHYSRDWFGYASVSTANIDGLVGERVVALDAGAYCEAMADRWADEPRPPVVVIDDGEVRVATEREGRMNLVRRDRDLPPRS